MGELMKIHGWKGFLSNPQTKANLLLYLLSCWLESSLPPDLFTLIIRVDTEGTRMTSNGKTVMDDFCYQGNPQPKKKDDYIGHNSI